MDSAPSTSSFYSGQPKDRVGGCHQQCITSQIWLEACTTASDALFFSSFESDMLYHLSSCFFSSSLNVAEFNTFGRRQDIAREPYLCVSLVIEFPNLLERIKILCTRVSNNSHLMVEASVLSSDRQPMQVAIKDAADLKIFWLTTVQSVRADSGPILKFFKRGISVTGTFTAPLTSMVLISGRCANTKHRRAATPSLLSATFTLYYPSPNALISSRQGTKRALMFSACPSCLPSFSTVS